MALEAAELFLGECADRSRSGDTLDQRIRELDDVCRIREQGMDIRRDE